MCYHRVMSKEKSAIEIERRSEAIAGVYAGFSKKLEALQKDTAKRCLGCLMNGKSVPLRNYAHLLPRHSLPILAVCPTRLSQMRLIKGRRGEPHEPEKPEVPRIDTQEALHEFAQETTRRIEDDTNGAKAAGLNL